MDNKIKVSKGRTLVLTIELTDDDGNTYILKNDEKQIGRASCRERV